MITPPFATAATTAAEPQLAAVPFPTTVVGRDVSTACAAAGTGSCPFGLPKLDGIAADEDAGRGVAPLAIAEAVGDAGAEDPTELGAGLPGDAAVSALTPVAVVATAAVAVGLEDPQAVTLTARANPTIACDARTKSREECTSRA